MNFNIRTPFDDWKEPFYTFIEIDGKKRFFLAQDGNVFMWADATDSTAKELFTDLINNSIWTPYAIMTLCEDERIRYGIIYVRYIINSVYE